MGPIPTPSAPFFRLASDVAAMAVASTPAWVIYLDAGNKLVAFAAGLLGLVLLVLRIRRAWRDEAPGGQRQPAED